MKHIYNYKIIIMTKLYKWTIEIDWEKMDEVINQFLVENWMKFKNFLVLMWDNWVDKLSSATYYSWKRRWRMRSEFAVKMEKIWIDVDLFIKK